MTRIYFVRHAQPDFTVEDDMIRPLTEEGLADTKKVLDFFCNKKIDEFYCSPYKRSADTIASSAEYFGKVIYFDERLREREKGINGNSTHDLIRKRWSDFDFHEEGGESINMVQKRNIDALTEILEMNRDKNIVIGTHGTALSAILNYYNRDFGCEYFFRIIDWMPYIIEVDFDGKKYLGYTEHFHIHKLFKNKI